MPEQVITFLPYQKRWLQDASRFKIGMFTRRGGKTFGAMGEAADDAIRAEIEGRRTRWTILSRSEATAKEAMEDALKPIVRGFWAAYNRMARGADPVFEEGEFHAPEMDATYKTHEVRFPGGSRIVALSASPDAARGFGGNLIDTGLLAGAEAYAANLEDGIARGVFGSPFYIVGDERFWGQDRLEDLDLHLAGRI